MQYGRVKDAAPYGGGTQKAAVRHQRWGGDGGLRLRRGIAPSADGALDDWGFRAVRGAGVSPTAAGDRGRCPLDPCDFLKKSSKTFHYSYKGYFLQISATAARTASRVAG